MKRRSFLRRIATAVAIVALAPEIAFRKTLELPDVPMAPIGDFWMVDYTVFVGRPDADLVIDSFDVQSV